MIHQTRVVRGLIVEGDPRIRSLLKDYLQSVVRFETMMVEDPFHLLALCESLPDQPTILLLDMEWSRVEGPVVIREVRKRAPWISILGMTSRQTELIEDPIIRKHSVGLIPKPLSPYHLQRSLNAVLAADGWLGHARASSPRLRDLIAIHLSGTAA